MERRITILVEKYMNGTGTAAEIAELHEWVSRSATDDAIHEALEKAWHTYQPDRRMPDDISQRILTAVLSDDQADPQKNTAGSYTPQLSPLRFRLFRYAAAASIVLMAISFWWLWRGDRKDMGATHENKHIVSTQKGLRSVTDLPDGTHVWLNADSHISYNDDFGESTREVTLTGEAFFDVAHNEAVPMIVHAKTVNILVKGTAFNVCSYPESDKVQTSLIRGSIELTTLDHPGQKILLKPNEKITIDVPSENTPANSDEHRKVQPAKIKEAKNRSFRIDSLKQSALTDGIPEISWIKNQLVFDNELFVDVIDKMEKWYNVDILLQNQSLGQKRFSGAFIQEENITEALSALRIINDFDFEIRGRNVIIK